MGNRAVITNKPNKGEIWEENIGIYLHWNGGRDSVEAFLKYCELRGFRATNRDNYGWARLVLTAATPYFARSTKAASPWRATRKSTLRRAFSVK